MKIKFIDKPGIARYTKKLKLFLCTALLLNYVSINKAMEIGSDNLTEQFNMQLQDFNNLTQQPIEILTIIVDCLLNKAIYKEIKSFNKENIFLKSYKLAILDKVAQTLRALSQVSVCLNNFIQFYIKDNLSKVLLKYNINLENDKDKLLITAVDEGIIYHDYLAVAKLLIINGADVNATDQYHNTSLINISKKSHSCKRGLDLAKLILKHGANPNAINENNTALNRAVINEDKELIKLLLNNKAQIDHQEDQVEAPLITAVTMNNLNMVKFLIEECNANIEIKNEIEKHAFSVFYGNTALMFAAYQGNIDILKYLIDKGANINHQNSNGDTALTLTVICSNNKEIIKTLIKAGADVSHKNHRGQTALDIIKHKAESIYKNLDRTSDYDQGLIKTFRDIKDLLE